MATEVSICNIALARLGKKPIADFSDAVPSAELCGTLYANARDAVLAMHPWNFCTRTISLSELSAESPGDYEYAYSYPADCLRALGIMNVVSGTRIPYEVRLTTDTKSRMIVCDESPATLRYICRVENPGLFSPQFVQAFALYLAEQLATPLTGVASMADRMHQLFVQELQLAQVSDCQEGPIPPYEENPYITARS